MREKTHYCFFFVFLHIRKTLQIAINNRLTFSPLARSVGDVVSVGFKMGSKLQRYRGRVQKKGQRHAYTVHFSTGDTWTVNAQRDDMRLIEAGSADVKEEPAVVPVAAAVKEEKADNQDEKQTDPRPQNSQAPTKKKKGGKKPATGEHRPCVMTEIGPVKCGDRLYIKWVEGDGQFYEADVTNVSDIRGVAVQYPDNDD